MEMDRSSNRITLGFLAGTIIIASALAMPYQKTLIFGMPALSFLGYVLSLLIILALFVSMVREKKI
jgi:hypothetical protein